MATVMTPADHDRVAEAIAAAEGATSGEIFAVVETRPASYPRTAFTVAVLASFALPLAAVLIAGLDPRMLPFDNGWSSGDGFTDIVRAIEAYAAAQALIFVAVLALVGRTALARKLTPRAVRTARVHRLAMSQFLSHGLHVTAERTGVLLFLSLPDHVAEVIADEGIYTKVDKAVWDETVGALIAGAKRGAPGEGFAQAVAVAGRVLAEHFPPRADNPNELPDRLIEL